MTVAGADVTAERDAPGVDPFASSAARRTLACASLEDNCRGGLGLGTGGAAAPTAGRALSPRPEKPLASAPGPASSNMNAPRTSPPHSSSQKPFSGKPETDEAWCSYMDFYVRLSDPDDAYSIACTFLDCEAFDWSKVYRQTTAGPNWESFRSALIRRISPLSKTQSAPDMLLSWGQTDDVATFNRTILSVLLDILYITEAEKNHRYS